MPQELSAPAGLLLNSQFLEQARLSCLQHGSSGFFPLFPVKINYQGSSKMSDSGTGSIAMGLLSGMAGKFQGVL
jgi:hypothetical protein